ncbi:hypothetical protein BZA70DRAFT_289445 [Myxozyma melibiosi]|uniref:Uncharacterized protein n=1 Tax=Myxozyma melibiosi TaxID=54550 RepID=A0ABR1F6Q4_9ASCO
MSRVDDDDGPDPQTMLARIQSLENRASMLHEENVAVFETNKELYKRIQELNSSLIASESLVERLLNSSKEDSDDNAIDERQDRHRPPPIITSSTRVHSRHHHSRHQDGYDSHRHHSPLSPDAPPSLSTPFRPARMGSSGSVTSRLNRFEILLDEFCSEFDASDDDSTSSIRSVGGARFSIHLDNRSQSRPGQRLQKSRTLSPPNVLREIGQQHGPTSPHEVRKIKRNMSSRLRSPGCLELSLSAALDQSFAATAPSSDSARTIQQRRADSRRRRSRYVSEKRLLPVAPAEPRTPRTPQTAMFTDAYRHRGEFSPDYQYDYSDSYFGGIHHRRESSMYSSEHEKNRSIAAVLESCATESISTFLETERHDMPPMTTFSDNDADTHDSFTERPRNHMIEQQSLEEQRQELLRKYNFTSDEDFYKDLRLPYQSRGATTPMQKMKSTEFGSPQQQRNLRAGKSMPALRRQTSALTLLSKEGMSPPFAIPTSVASTSLSKSPEETSALLEASPATGLLCKLPSNAATESRSVSAAMLESMKKYNDKQLQKTVSSSLKSAQLVERDGILRSVVGSRPQETSEDGPPNAWSTPRRPLRSVSSYIWDAIWRVPSPGEQKRRKVRRVRSQFDQIGRPPVPPLPTGDPETLANRIESLTVAAAERSASVSYTPSEVKSEEVFDESRSERAVEAESSEREIQQEEAEAADPSDETSIYEHESEPIDHFDHPVSPRSPARTCEEEIAEPEVDLAPAEEEHWDIEDSQKAPDEADEIPNVTQQCDSDVTEGTISAAYSFGFSAGEETSTCTSPTVSDAGFDANKSASARPSLSKRASWMLFPSVLSPTTESPTSEVPVPAVDESKVSHIFGWRNPFKKRVISEDYISFPTFSGSASSHNGSIRFKAGTTPTISPATSTPPSSVGMLSQHGAWSSFGSITNVALSANKLCNPHSIIDELNAYRAHVSNQRASTINNTQDGVECTTIDERALQEALSSQEFQYT